MSFDPVTESEIMDWHRSRGGSGTRAAGHALRILRECVELCVASGATEAEIKMAVRRECDKAENRKEFTRIPTYQNALEEFVDVKILMTVYRNYFIPHGSLDNEMRRKLDVCSGREWEPDADGVLWRPGTRASGSAPVEPDRS
jgi:hypothetical protein